MKLDAIKRKSKKLLVYYFTKFHIYNLQLPNHTQSLCSK